MGGRVSQRHGFESHQGRLLMLFSRPLWTDNNIYLLHGGTYYIKIKDFILSIRFILSHDGKHEMNSMNKLHVDVWIKLILGAYTIPSIKNLASSYHVRWQVFRSVMTVTKMTFLLNPCHFITHNGMCCIKGCTLIIMSGLYSIKPASISLFITKTRIIISIIC